MTNDIFNTGRIDYRDSTCHIGGQSDCGIGCEVVEGMNKGAYLYGFELYGNELFDYLRKEYSIPYGDADGLLEAIVKYAYVNFTEPNGKPSTEGIDLLEGIIDFAFDGEHPLDRQEVYKAWCVPIIGEESE